MPATPAPSLNPSGLLAELRRVLPVGVSFPQTDQVREQLLSVAFFAGLQREEGRPLSFTLAFIDPSTIETPGYAPFSALAFERPLALTVEHVVKLAPALDPRVASIGVGEGQHGLEIWGLFRHGSSEHEMLEGLTSAAIGLGVDYVSLVASRPGRLDVDIGMSRIASFVDGRIEAGIRVFSDRGPVYDLLVGAGRLQGDNSYLEDVQQIAWYIRAAQHGGTLLLLPDESLKLLDSRHTIAPVSRAAGDLRDRLRARREAILADSKVVQKIADTEGRDERVHPHTAIRSRSTAIAMLHTAPVLRDSLAFLAALANVDGALVLGPDLRILAFGAVITRTTRKNLSVKLARACDGKAGEKVGVQKLGGTRHQSAAHFCANREGALAVVISQDGGVSCMLNTGRVVCVWKGVRLDRRQSPATPVQSGTRRRRRGGSKA
jgi:hypothetical protein